MIKVMKIIVLKKDLLLEATLFLVKGPHLEGPSPSYPIVLALIYSKFLTPYTTFIFIKGSTL